MSFEIKFSGHRGYKDKDIENTKAGFLRAIEEKLDYVEIDIRKSSDNIPVVFHDSKVNRLLNGKGKVREYSLKELKEFHYRDSQNILTLEEFFSLVKGKIKVILDVKSKGIINEILALIREYKLEKVVIVQSFSGKSIKKWHEIAPDLEFCLYRALIGKSTRPHKFFAPIWYRFLIKPYKIKYVSLDGPFMYEKFLSICHKNGIKIILGAMKTEKYLKYIESWNVSIINANDPVKIRKILIEKGN